MGSNKISKDYETAEITPPVSNKTKIFIVETPVPNYNGVVAGVQFAYGKAEVHSGWVLNWFKENGYKVTPK